MNVQFYGQAMEVPYTSGLIKLDGADLPLMHLLQEVDVGVEHSVARDRRVGVAGHEEYAQLRAPLGQRAGGLRAELQSLAVQLFREFIDEELCEQTNVGYSFA